MCSSETTWNLFRHIMVSDFCKEIANFCMASPQHGRNVKLKKLHCKSPSHSYFQKRAFSHQTKHFLGTVHKRKCVWKTAPEKCLSLSLESIWSCQEASEKEWDLKIQLNHLNVSEYHLNFEVLSLFMFQKPPDGSKRTLETNSDTFLGQFFVTNTFSFMDHTQKNA